MHARRVHRARRVQAVDGHVLRVELGREVDREHDLRELAAAIRVAGVVAALHHDVGEIDRRLAHRGHVDDARRRARFEQRQQAVSQQEVRKIVHGERELVSVGARLPLGAADGGGVVDEHVEPVVGLHDRLRQRGDSLKRREIGAMERRIAGARGFDRADDFLAALLIAAVHDDEGAERAELPRDFLAEAVRRARDEHGLAVQRDAHARPVGFVLGYALLRGGSAGRKHARLPRPAQNQRPRAKSCVATASPSWSIIRFSLCEPAR